jgi:TPR repeat protein
MQKDDYEKFLEAHRITNDDNAKDEDKKRAYRIWLELAEKEYVRSTFYLGVCYDNGIGIRKNLKKAFANFLWAAGAGHVEAQYNVYQILERGYGVEKNGKEALKWLKKAAIQGKDIGAIRDLGFHFHEGRYVRKNFKKSVEFYRIAAKKNDHIAQWNLGLSYESGDGVKASQRWSLYWIEKAAKQGHEAAASYLKNNST